MSTKMLVDTGSMVTLAKTDLWDLEAAGEPRKIRPPSRSIVIANGKALEIMGQVDICFSIGDFSCSFWFWSLKNGHSSVYWVLTFSSRLGVWLTCREGTLSLIRK